MIDEADRAEDINLENFDVNEILNIENELEINENEFLDLIKKEINNEANNEDFLFKEEKGKTEKDDLQKILLDNIKKEISSILESSKKNFLDSINNEFVSFETNLNKAINRLKFNDDDENDQINQLNGIGNYIPFIINNEDNIAEPIVLSIDSDQKDYEVSKNQANNIIINDLIIKNLSKSEIKNKNFHWVRDNESNKDIDIQIDKKEIKIKDFGINEEKKAELNLMVRNPKINENYFMKVYVCDDANENVTKNSFFINIKIIDEVGNDEEKIYEEKIYEELNGEYYFEGVIDKEVVYEKIREYNGDMDRLRSFIEENL